ncbi:TRAP-type C4-dicarboxylate transport system permease small subunit [Rhodovulum imhoffii]|uniref:TRAP transporter small permease protein n=1 Tax=Rhodovulum imhoffii TaxID=365340 RepID=A0A2T5BL93_9RHOB|nr:TRAP transporter small permease subunit [Rhodovulum imhoffii]MBK5933762.1 C4-dicarboxylate ABC transporter substrate-binding protein [Rhodovulum imhoffii]PTM99722.1 TRAP-type C4-dicarboxylate transport system permease small subunit [Rhodovulum imhoffii]
MVAIFEKLLLWLIETICIVLLVSLAFSVIYSTTMRYLGASPSWYDEIASVLLAWLTYFGATYALFLRQHMGFGSIVMALPKRAGVALTLFSEFLVIAFFAVVAFYGNAVLAAAKWDSLLSIRWMTLDIVQSVIPITAVLMIVGTLLTAPRVVKNVVDGIDVDHAEIEQAIADAERENAEAVRKDKRA